MENRQPPAQRTPARAASLHDEVTIRTPTHRRWRRRLLLNLLCRTDLSPNPGRHDDSNESVLTLILQREKHLSDSIAANEVTSTLNRGQVSCRADVLVHIRCKVFSCDSVSMGLVFFLRVDRRRCDFSANVVDERALVALCSFR